MYTTDVLTIEITQTDNGYVLAWSRPLDSSEKYQQATSWPHDSPKTAGSYVFKTAAEVVKQVKALL